MDSTSIITTAITRLDEEIERLTEAREDLVALVQEHEIVDAPKSRRSTRKPTKAPKATTTKASTKKASPKQPSSEPTRREIIMDLLDEGMSVADIADELDIKPNYVYHVKRDWKELVA